MPAEVAKDVLELLEVAPPETVSDVAALVARVSATMPRGSTAKIRAIENGQRPAGADPGVVAEEWLTDPRIAWTCWAISTLTAALVHTGPLRADVLGLRRTDGRSPAVDVHSIVAISDGEHRWICDPHFGVAPIPIGGGRFQRPAVDAELVPGVDGRFEWSVAVPSIPGRLSYRSLTGPLDEGDVAMFCDVSVAHSGLSARPTAMLMLHDGLGSLRAETWTHPAELRLWRGTAIEVGNFDVQHHESWDIGMDALLLAARADPVSATFDDDPAGLV